MSDSPRWSRSWLINLGLVAAAMATFLVCLGLGTTGASEESSQESFVGTDTTAVEAIEGDHPTYQPWFNQIFAPPSAEIESGLFALQAAVGGGILGYAIGALRRRRTTEGTRAMPADSGGDGFR